MVKPAPIFRLCVTIITMTKLGKHSFINGDAVLVDFRDYDPLDKRLLINEDNLLILYYTLLRYDVYEDRMKPEEVVKVINLDDIDGVEDHVGFIRIIAPEGDEDIHYNEKSEKLVSGILEFIRWYLNFRNTPIP